MKDSKTKGTVKAARKKYARRQASTPATELPTEPQTPKKFTTKWHHSSPDVASKAQAASYLVLRVNDYDIANSWILDSRSNIHICNDLSRFKIIHSTMSEDYLISRSTTYSIETYSTINITVTSPTSKEETVTLNQVALILGFFINLV